MKNTTRWATLVLSVAGLGIFSAIPSVAEPTTQPSSSSSATGNCTISGTVMKDGKPLPNARVALFVAREHAKTGKNGAAASAAADNNTATTQPSADDGEKKKHDRGDA